MKKESKKESCHFPGLFAGNWLVGLLILLVVVDICLHISHTVIESEHIVLTFVGILATFIVVSNYMQVKEVKDDFAKQSLELQEELDAIKTELSKKVNAYLRVKPDKITFPAEGGTVKVEVDSNSEWIAE